MNSTISHKGYTGSVSVSIEDGCLHGKILFINDLITYESDTVPGLQKEFSEAVDDYVQTCEELGVAPDKPCSGTFNVRIGPELHRKAIVAASKNDQNLNDFVKTSIESALAPPPDPKIDRIVKHVVSAASVDDFERATASTVAPLREVKVHEKARR